MYNKDLIYDVGMHNGNDIAYYLSRGYPVVSIEADPVLAEKAKNRFAGQLTNKSLPKGSSGNFGESLEGEWYGLEEAKTFIAIIKMHIKRFLIIRTSVFESTFTQRCNF